MAKYVAKQPNLSNVPLQGLNIISSPSGSTFDPRKSSGFTLDNGTAQIDISGSGFKYFGGRPSLTGTVKSIDYYVDDVLYYKVSKFTLPFKYLGTTSDTKAIAERIFAKKDVLKGSDGRDHLYGLGGKDSLQGRDGNDYLYGGSKNDRLDGGEGADYLDGGKDIDTFVFSAHPATGIDTIISFEAGETIELSAKVFPAPKPGPLSADQFALGPKALDADDHVLYDPETGALRYDPDGNGELDASTIAMLPVALDFFGSGSILVA